MKIVIPDLVSNSYFPAIAAIELGCFSRAGISITLEHIFPVDKCLEGLRSGKWEFVVGTAHALPQVFPGYRGAKFLSTVGRHTYWFLVMHSDLNVARGDLNALQGSVIGAAPMVEQGLRGIFSEAGIDIAEARIDIGPVPGAARPGVSFGVQAAKALEAGAIDGFWANGLGTALAVERGIGTVVIDARRGDGPRATRTFTFAALMTSDAVIEGDPHAAAACMRAISDAQTKLKRNPVRATDIARAWFPETEAELAERVVTRDLPYYVSAIHENDIRSLNAFVEKFGFDESNSTFDDAVAPQNLREIWNEAMA